MNRREVSALIASRGDLDEQEREELAARMQEAEDAASIGSEGWMLLLAAVLVLAIYCVVFYAEFGVTL